MGMRRRVPRHEANLRGFLLLEGELTTVGWRECGIHDFSTLGIGITFHHARMSELIGQTVLVEIPSASGSDSVRTKGEIKNVRMLQHGFVRAGIEFDGSSTTERVIVALLSALNKANDGGQTVLRVTRPG